MDPLLKKAGVPDDHSMYVGKLMDEPFWGDFGVGEPHYSLQTRPLWLDGPGMRYGEAELVLVSGERIPVYVIGFEKIMPHPDAWELGLWGPSFWKPSDSLFEIRDTDLTPEQAKQARYFVQPAAPTKSNASTSYKQASMHE